MFEFHGNTCLSLLLLLSISGLSAQTDTSKIKSSEEEEDYSIYENAQAESAIKLWCNPKIFDLSPNRFISVGYDYIHTNKMQFSPAGNYSEDEKDIPNTRTYELMTYGLRVNANIPVISKTKLLWQMGGGYIHSNYYLNEGERVYDSGSTTALYKTLKTEGLKSCNLNSTLFKPLGEKTFMIVQLMCELNGNYKMNSSTHKPDFNTVRTSASVLYGKRPHDRFQWAVGISRTYRAGELNYIPVILYNYTSLNRKWGTEILFPARAAYRRKFNPRNILLAGYELEGGSYRLYNTGIAAKNIEFRRSELRVRLDYQRQLIGFFWIAFQAGIRNNISINADTLGESNKDFFRGFFGNQKYLMLNEAALTPYFNISINLVSP